MWQKCQRRSVFTAVQHLMVFLFWSSAASSTKFVRAPLDENRLNQKNYAAGCLLCRLFKCKRWTILYLFYFKALKSSSRSHLLCEQAVRSDARSVPLVSVTHGAPGLLLFVSLVLHENNKSEQLLECLHSRRAGEEAAALHSLSQTRSSLQDRSVRPLFGTTSALFCAFVSALSCSPPPPPNLGSRGRGRDSLS